MMVKDPKRHAFNGQKSIKAELREADRHLYFIDSFMTT